VFRRGGRSDETLREGIYPHAKRPGEIIGETLVRQKYGGLAGVRASVDSTGRIIPPEL